jgi:hypothetical protein
MGTGEAVTMSTAVLRLCGQDSKGPRLVAPQSNDWMRRFMSFAGEYISREAMTGSAIS